VLRFLFLFFTVSLSLFLVPNHAPGT